MKYRLHSILEDKHGRKIKKILKIIPSRINAMHFSEVEKLIGQAVEECNIIKNEGIEIQDEGLANTAYLLRIYCSMWGSISLFWKCAKSREYEGAWFHLQDGIDRNNILSKNLEDESELNTYKIQQYLLAYEEVFPYNIFSSMGLTSTSCCSICKKDSFDNTCIHVPGRIYWGQMANTVIETAEIKEISLTKTPEDKRCVPKKDDSFFSDVQRLFDYVGKPLNVLIYDEERRHVDVVFGDCISVYD